MKRKRLSREAIKFRTGEPLKYGSNWKLPRPQERVPRSLQRPLMPSRREGMTLLDRLVRRSLAKPVLQLKLPPVRRLVGVTPRSRKVGKPSGRQYNFMHVLRVANPKRVLFCVKRKIRREVLFAFRRAGRKGSGPGRRRTYRRNGNSLYGC